MSSCFLLAQYQCRCGRVRVGGVTVMVNVNLGLAFRAIWYYEQLSEILYSRKVLQRAQYIIV